MKYLIILTYLYHPDLYPVIMGYGFDTKEKCEMSASALRSQASDAKVSSTRYSCVTEEGMMNAIRDAYLKKKSEE